MFLFCNIKILIFSVLTKRCAAFFADIQSFNELAEVELLLKDKK